MHPAYIKLVLQEVRREGKCAITISEDVQIEGMGKAYDGSAWVITFPEGANPTSVAKMKKGTYWTGTEIVVPHGGKLLLGRDAIDASKSKNSLSACWSRFLR